MVKAFAAFLLSIATAFAIWTAARADGGGARADVERALKDHTLVFQDKTSGLENSIYFGRFGNNFDRYVPCVESAGTWRIESDGRLCLEEDEGPFNACFKVSVSSGVLSLSSQDGGTVQAAKLLDGNQLPFG